MTAQVDTREPTNFATDKSFYAITRVASKKFSSLRRRISGRDSVRNLDVNSLTISNNKQQRAKVNSVQQENFYFAGQRTNYNQKSPKMDKDNVLRKFEESNDSVAQDLQLTNLTNKEIEQSSTNEKPLKRNSSLGKVKNAVKRFASIRQERKRDSEAYHQDGKTNPFE
ncbi:11800_t:CDS:1 [Dentiscutata erythropus]|uniref:11800_t:CDS:1 n=1 Tax=Dentiscutata erythropus TaxID=1348616 RepID=A0A9N9P129_9GLOM|nr:11800_t:CDS:1 [Dentiscutata erythropus]